MKVQLYAANNVINNDLVTVDSTHDVVKFTYLIAHGQLAFFKPFLASLQFADIGYNLVPNRTSVMELLIYFLLYAIHLLLEALKSRVNFADMLIQIFDRGEDLAVLFG